MSKFVDALSEVEHPSSGVIGFGPTARRSNAAPSILLAGQVTPQRLAKNPDLAEARVDALLLWMDSWDESGLDKVKDYLRERVWGVRLDNAGAEQARRLKDMGCDFIVFDAENTEAGVLDEEDLGKVISVAGDLDEDVARAVNELPIDAAFFAAEQDLRPVTVARLIHIQSVRGLLDRPFVMTAPGDLRANELDALRNAGITGLSVELSSLDEVSGLRKAIDGLPRRKVRPASRDALVPHVAQESVGDMPAPDEEGDDDDDF